MACGGSFPRPSKERTCRATKKGAKKIHRKKLFDLDKNLRKTTGIALRREASTFHRSEYVGLTGKEAEIAIQLESPRECYVWKGILLTGSIKFLWHDVVRVAATSIMPNVSKRRIEGSSGNWWRF